MTIKQSSRPPSSGYRIPDVLLLLPAALALAHGMSCQPIRIESSSASSARCFAKTQPARALLQGLASFVMYCLSALMHMWNVCRAHTKTKLVMCKQTSGSLAIALGCHGTTNVPALLSHCVSETKLACSAGMQAQFEQSSSGGAHTAEPPALDFST